jgi:hypothetical protein
MILARDRVINQQVLPHRLLAEARKKYLREEVRFLKQHVDDETMQQILKRTSRSDLSERLDRLTAAGIVRETVCGC